MRFLHINNDLLRCRSAATNITLRGPSKAENPKLQPEVQHYDVFYFVATKPWVFFRAIRTFSNAVDWPCSSVSSLQETLVSPVKGPNLAITYAFRQWGAVSVSNVSEAALFIFCRSKNSSTINRTRLPATTETITVNGSFLAHTNLDPVLITASTSCIYPGARWL